MRGREEDSRRVKPEHLCLSPVEAGGAEPLNSTPPSFIPFRQHRHHQTKHRRHHPIIIISHVRIRISLSSTATHRRRRIIVDLDIIVIINQPTAEQRHYSFTLALLLWCNDECVCRLRPPEVDCDIELFELLGLAFDNVVSLRH